MTKYETRSSKQGLVLYQIAEKEDSRNGLVFDPPVGRLGKVSELPLLSAFEQVVFPRDGGNREARLKTVTGGNPAGDDTLRGGQTKKGNHICDSL